MSIPLEYGYLLGNGVFLALWLIFFFVRKDIRREMLVMSCLIGFLSVVTAYYWWTQDWWHPQTITGTKVGVEDFLMGFASGGIMAVIYEVVFKKQLYKRPKQQHRSGGLTVLFALAFFTSWFFWGIGLTSFWASAVAMICSSLLLYYLRKDLFIDSVASGVLMLLLALPFYFSIIFFVPGWINATYNFDHLSGVLVAGIPIEELIFWFLAGLVFGPFYEYWKGEKLRQKVRRKHSDI